jgi:hypothetical protein
MAKAMLEVPESFKEWVAEEARRRGVAPEELLEELRTRAERHAEPKVELLQVWWHPSMSTQRPEEDPYPDNCYVVLQLGLRVFNAGERRYLASDFGVEITMGDERRPLDHAGALPNRLVTGPARHPSHAINLRPQFGPLYGPGDILSVGPDDFAEATLNFKSRPAGPLQAGDEPAPFRLWWTDQDGTRFELEDTAAPIVTGVRPVR